MSCIAVGNFDGVHKGHLKIVKTAAEIAKNKDIPAVVVTFGSNTKRTLGGKTKYLSDNGCKLELLLAAGADRVDFVEFTPELAAMSGHDFIRLLKEKYGLMHIVCGDNFKFGCKASCGISELKKIAAIENIGYTVVETNDISSTRIRRLVENGEIEAANELLGRDFSYYSQFISGNHIGRTMGYPTLNQAVMAEYVIPLPGVYVTYCVSGGKRYPAVTNIGTRPTVTSDGEVVIETYLLGLESVSEDMLNDFTRVYFLKRIRGERRFPDREALSAQISRDCQYALSLF